MGTVGSLEEMLIGAPSALASGSYSSHQELVDYLVNTRDLSHLEFAKIRTISKDLYNVIRSKPELLNGAWEKVYHHLTCWIEKVLPYTRQGNRDLSLFLLLSTLYSDAGNVARLNYNNNSLPFSESIGWTEAAYFNTRTAAEISYHFFSKDHSANLFSFAGEDAEQLAKRLIKNPAKSRKYAKNAVECYTKFVEHFKSSSDPKKQESVMILRNSISYLNEHFQLANIKQSQQS